MPSIDALPLTILQRVIENTYQPPDPHTHPHQLQHIKGQLCKYALVNHHFYAATHALIWSVVSIRTASQGDLFVTSTTTLSKHANGRHVRHLIYHHPLRSDRILLRLLPHLSRLTHLDLSDATRITDTSLQQLPMHCPNMTHLKLRNSLISNNTIHAVANHCPLIHLQLANCPGINGDLFLALEGCKTTLTTLEIEVTLMTREDWMTTTAPHLINVATRLAQLTHLKIICAPSTFLQWLVITLAQPPSWPHLVSLSLGGGGGECTIGDTELISMIQARPGLTSLALEGEGVQIKDTTLHAMAALLPELETVRLAYMRHVTAHAVRRLIQWCPRLNSITFFGCRLVNYEFPELEVAAPHLLSARVQELAQPVLDKIRMCEDSEPGEFDHDDEMGRHQTDVYGVGGRYGHQYWDEVDPRHSLLWQVLIAGMPRRR